MLVLVLLIIAAVIFGIAALYPVAVRRGPWDGPGITALAFCLLSVALAFWHAGK